MIFDNKRNFQGMGNMNIPEGIFVNFGAASVVDSIKIGVKVKNIIYHL